MSELIVDGPGATMRSLLVDRRDDTQVPVSWDGLDEFGVVVPEGIYTARLTARDAQGDLATSSVRVGVSRKVPGVWTPPSSGSRVSATVDLVVTPRPVAGADLGGL